MVIGVAADGFTGLQLDAATDIIVPLAMMRAASGDPSMPFRSRTVVGRLARVFDSRVSATPDRSDAQTKGWEWWPPSRAQAMQSSLLLRFRALTYPSDPGHEVPPLRHRAWDRSARQPRPPGRGHSGRPACPHCHRPVPERPWRQPRHRPRGSELHQSPRRRVCWARSWSAPSVTLHRNPGPRSRARGRAHWRRWSSGRGVWSSAPRASPPILSPWQPRRRPPTGATGRQRR